MSSGVEDRAAVAYARFGLGRRADEPVHGDDAYIRLLQEVNEGHVPEPGDGRLPSSAQIFQGVGEYRELGKAATGDNLPKSPVRDYYFAEVDARYNGTMLEADTGLTERLVMFWANHFAISRDKHLEINAASGAFEREAIRPFVYGRFFDMLLAVETHPCMISFLDNQFSSGLNSRRSAVAGLNENLAREIMELHTLGVRTGYNQADVTAFARVLTGWTIATPKLARGTPGAFFFDESRHQPGGQTIMGRTYPESGFMQGAHVLRDLASHPATAHHIATKLAAHFVSDTPPPSLVTKLERAYLDSEGDLRAVTRALVQSDEAMVPAVQKMRLPQEYIAATQRALGIVLEPKMIDTSLVTMGQPLWRPGGPNGYSDASGVWMTPVSLAARVAFANRVAHMTENLEDPRTFAENRLAGRLTDATRAAIAHAETRPQGLAITFLSPEFIRR